MSYKIFEPSDRDAIRAYTMPSDINICDLAISNLYGWGFLYKTSWAIIEEALVIRFTSPHRNHPVYLCPVSREGCHIREAIDVLAKECEEEGYPLTLMGITPNCRNHLEELFPDAFTFFNDRNYCDYIYEREKLCTLAGKKLQSKRNHANRFEREHPGYEYVDIDREIAKDCLKLEQEWLKKRGSEDGEENEKNMIRRVMNNMDALGVTGGAIRIDGRVVAFSIGGPINHNTFGIHIEKADTSVDGTFTIINREFARRIPSHFDFINREEDLGLEGLRQSKLSYKPELLLPKATAILRHDKI